MSLFILVLLFGVVFSQGPPAVKVHLYAMSKCPYAAYLVGEFQKHAMSKIGIPAIVNFTIDYIAKVDPTQPSGFSSKHGPTEVTGDFYELCLRQTDPTHIWSLLVCAYEHYNDVPGNLHPCANMAGIPWSPVLACYNSQRSNLLKASIAATDSLHITNSPTFYIDGQCVYGSEPNCQNLDPQSDLMLHMICKAYTGTKPSGCKM